ncbi:hypothetical protein CDD83_2703 [Cordyceps sp. RAO-2017]|nr:hypothetical protein CDD83_2703 [Cordyceps sp. RAO-2017]
MALFPLGGFVGCGGGRCTARASSPAREGRMGRPVRFRRRGDAARKRPRGSARAGVHACISQHRVPVRWPSVWLAHRRRLGQPARGRTGGAIVAQAGDGGADCAPSRRIPRRPAAPPPVPALTAGANGRRSGAALASRASLWWTDGSYEPVHGWFCPSIPAKLGRLGSSVRTPVRRRESVQAEMGRRWHIVASPRASPRHGAHP